jgi:hypothetical protein
MCGISKSSPNTTRRSIVAPLLLASAITCGLALFLPLQIQPSQEFCALSEAHFRLSPESHHAPEPSRPRPTHKNEPERIRESISTLVPWGWPPYGLRTKIENISTRFTGALVRPLSEREMELITPVLKSDASWVKLIGYHLLNRPSGEVERVSTGITLATSTGITDSARLELSSEISPILEEWRSASPRASWLGTLSIALICVLFPLFVATLLTRNGNKFGPHAVGFGGIAASACLGASMSVLLTVAHWKSSPIVPWLFAILLISAVSASLLTLSHRPSPYWKTFTFAKVGIVLFVSLAMTVSGMAIRSVLPVSEGGVPAVLLMLTLSTLVVLCVGGRCPAIMMAISTPTFSAAAAFAWSFAASLVFFWSPQLLDLVWVISDTPRLVPSVSSMVAVALLSTFSFVLVFIVKMMQSGKVPLSVSQESEQSRPSHLSVVLSVTIFSLLGAFFTGSNVKPMQRSAPTAQAVSWETAVTSSKEGTGIVVDARPPGTHPEIPSDALIDPDSSDDFLKEFCSFATGRRVYVFCASSSCDISAVLASRLTAFCPSGAFHIEGGAESWPLLK